MERVRRRWWTWSVSVLAVLVILAAAISGLFQLAVLELPSYRDRLSDWVTQVAGRPVDIDGVNLVWSGIHPRLDLEGITLYAENGEDEVLSADRLSLGFGLLRLATGDLMPDSIELSGLSLAVNVDAQGHVDITGLDASPEAKPDYAQWLKQIEHFHRVRLLDSDVQVTAPQLPDSPLSLHLAQADFVRTLRGLRAQAHFDLPPNYGKSLALDADLDGDLVRPASWSGKVKVQVDQPQPQPWLRRWLQAGTRVGIGPSLLEIDGRLQAGKFTAVDAHLQSGPMLAARAGHTTTLHSLEFLAHAAPSAAGGWQVDVARLVIDGSAQLHGSFQYVPAADGSGFDLGVEADQVRLDRIAPWLSHFRSKPLLLAAQASGDIDGLVLRLHDGGDTLQYQLRAVLKNFGYAAGDGPAGVAGIDGELSADEDGGRLHLAGGGVTLELPQAMRGPVPFDALTGELQWHRQSGGWQLSMPQFTWQLTGTQGQGVMSLLLPSAEGQSPDLDLTASFDATDVNRLKAFIPTHWHPHLHDWLVDGILGGRVANGVLRIHGPLADFPYEKNPDGKWKLDFDANAIKLRYHPDWPEVDGIDAHLTFTGNRLDISADSGSVKGLQLVKAQARFADFGDAQLQVDATVGGELPRFYDFLRASPLKTTLAGLVDHTSASGAARVQVHLDIPLKAAEQTEVNGDVALDGAQLRYKGLSQPIRDISGNIEFSRHGVTSTPLHARFEDLDLDVRVVPREGTEGVVSAGFDYGLKADGSGASGFVPELLRKSLSGHAHWTAELPLADDTGLTLRTDMKGIAVALPEPLGKAAEQAVPLSIVIDAGDGDTTRVRVRYQDRLSADLALAPATAGDAAAGATVTGVNLQLGKGPAPAATRGIYVGGTADDLDLGAWHAALGTIGKSSLALQKIDLHAGHLHLLGQTVSDVHLVSTPADQGSSTLLDGAGAEGEVDWDASAGGRLTARLKHLRLDAQPPPTDEAAAGPGAAEAPARDPAQLPQLDIKVDQLDAGSADLGKATLLTQRIAGGQSLAQCELAGGKTTLGASGQWTRLNGQSGAALKFDLDSHDIAAVLKAFGYAPNLDAKDSHFTGDLKWPARAAGLKWELAQGPITIDVKTGKLSAVESGAGRVLGLLNFYALPRRLTLDFRDVTGSGLAFDHIGGSFDLADGVARTGNLDIDGPSLRMEVRGRVGLLARDLDQTVKVYPSVSSGVTLGAALLGGPAVGALVLIAQQVLKQPLEKLTELDYHVTGPWDNPKIQ